MTDDRDSPSPPPPAPEPPPAPDPNRDVIVRAAAPLDSGWRPSLSVPPPPRCTCDTIAARDCSGGLPGCDHPTPAPGYDPDGGE